MMRTPDDWEMYERRARVLRDAFEHAVEVDDNGEDSAAENDSDESDGDGEGGRVGGVFVLDEAEDE